MYQGKYFQLNSIDSFVELVFDSNVDNVNTLSKAALEDLSHCVDVIEQSDARGLIIRSGKKLFSAGADVKAFRALFNEGSAAVSGYLAWVQAIYNRIEDLPMPKVAIVNGTVVGGGFELALLADYRIATPCIKMSLPEVKLGIFPAWGGLTRLSRIVGLDSTMQWVTTGKTYKADDALKFHVVDGVIDVESVTPIDKALQMLSACLAGELDWRSRYQEKQQPMMLNEYELAMSINVARGMVAKIAGKHYPAPAIILDALEISAKFHRDESLSIERSHINRCIETGVPDALVAVFLADMAVKSVTKSRIKDVASCDEVGVIGAGIMGGGIAYVSADKGMNVIMKDIHQDGLNLGLTEATSLLVKLVEKGRKNLVDMGNTLNRIVPTLHSQSLQNSELVIEAVVENPQVKAKVLVELEVAAPNAMLASNTSTLMISGLAQALTRPEQFCGIHFFNPVHIMPLVEVIRGEKTSEETINKAVKYVTDLGKTPIVVNDCAGFLVNRCLAPYFLAFNQLVVDGCNFAQIDKVMSKDFGWPMGPAHLLDVIGLDTTAHCIDVMDRAFPERLVKPKINMIQALVDQKQIGQKSSHGFYLYKKDKRGRMKPEASFETMNLVDTLTAKESKFESDAITMRMMLPMMFEAIRCLDEGIIASPQDGDIAMIYGTGFPPFRGGLFYYMDNIGLNKLLAIAEDYQHLGPLYQVPRGLLERVQNGQSFYS